ncbi:MFS transporter [Priestia aryabhattai]|uniref:MFS transporter n=1 Tax=Priestia aryabhattai TaxID=412384 RepID=UPI002380AC1C|nr:MFS transporter [Priestia aryabhattai]WDW10030.1 MFS transporter [Priestia aryabhattai]
MQSQPTVKENAQAHTKEATLFKSKPFIFALLSIIFNSLGMSIYLLTESWYVVNHLGMGNVLGIVLMATAIPRLILMPIGGVLADRFKRTKIMFISDFLRGILLVGMVIFFMFGTLTFPFLIGFALIFGILDAFYWPASSSLIPTVISEENLAQANSIVQVVQQVFFLGGPLLGGSLLTFGSYPLAFSAIAVIMILGAFVSLYVGKWFTQPHEENTEESSSFLEEWKEGFRFVKYEPFIRIIIITVIIAGFFVTGPLSMAVPLIVDSVLKGNALMLSYLEVSVSIGMILGGTIIAFSKIRKKRTLLSLLSLALCGLCLFYIGLSKQFLMIFSLLLLSGLVLTFSNTFFITLIQEKTPVKKIGRVMSLVTTATTGLLPLSQALISFWLSNGTSISQVLMIFGIIVSFFCLIVICISKSARTI